MAMNNNSNISVIKQWTGQQDVKTTLITDEQYLRAQLFKDTNMGTLGDIPKSY